MWCICRFKMYSTFTSAINSAVCGPRCSTAVYRWVSEPCCSWTSTNILLRQKLLTVKQHTHTHPFNGPFSRTTQVSWYQKGGTNLDFTEARDSEWQWQQLGQMQVCTLLQTDNHTSIPPLSFLQAGCPSCRPTNSVKALTVKQIVTKSLRHWWVTCLAGSAEIMQSVCMSVILLLWKVHRIHKNAMQQGAFLTSGMISGTANATDFTFCRWTGQMQY